MPAYITKSKGTVYGTPTWILDKYLPATYKDVAPHPFQPEIWNGLTMDWAETPNVNYCNPPFQDLARKWADVIKNESLKGKLICLLMPARTSSNYTREKLLPYCKHIVFLPKVKFIDYEDKCETKSVCPAAIILMYFNYKPENLEVMDCTMSL